VAFKNHLIHKCDIYRPTTSTGVLGEQLKTGETLVEADIACRFVEKSERRIIDEESEDLVVTTYLLLLAPDSQIQERDIVRNIELDSSTTKAGPFYTNEVRNRYSSTLHHKSAVIRLLDQ